VIVDEPQEQHYGGIVAAPSFKRIAYETLNYLNVPPRQVKSVVSFEKPTTFRNKGANG
jgi:hypothetical protein